MEPDQSQFETATSGEGEGKAQTLDPVLGDGGPEIDLAMPPGDVFPGTKGNLRPSQLAIDPSTTG